MMDKVRVEFFYTSGESTEITIPYEKWKELDGKLIFYTKNVGSNYQFLDLTHFVEGSDDTNQLFVNMSRVETIVVGQPLTSSRKVLCE